MFLPRIADVPFWAERGASLFLLGSEMDFKVDKLVSTFTFRNPNETSACGCGESVAITPANPEALGASA